MTFNLIIVLISVLSLWFLLFNKATNNELWRATQTPLASIIGSGFLIIGPILQLSFGYLAPLAMLALCALAYAFGWAIRSNMNAIDNAQSDILPNKNLEHLSSISLAFAFFVSVAYYLNLFGAFFVNLTPFNSSINAKIVTSIMLLIILAVGVLRGFTALERLERYAVAIKLAIIASLLFAFMLFFQWKVAEGSLVTLPVKLSGLDAITLSLGLIVAVQGFETSRYLGETYSATIRIRSMRLAQIVSTLIYVLYVSLISYAFKASEIAVSETAIIDLTRTVASILPVLLVIAALSAQMSAAIADTSGAAGLIEELTRHKIKEKFGYVFVVVSGLVLTWTTDIFAIISFASRAFAAYYALQSFIALKNALRTRRYVAAAACLVLTLIGVAAVLFAAKVE